jgi:6-phosphofructokinase 1
MATFGLLVGGGPAPGINGVIGSATTVARRRGARVLGILNGFEWLMRGDIDHVEELDSDSVARIHERGGSILRTSRANPTRDPANLDRVVDSLGRLGIDHLITIGGDDTCFSAKRVAETAGERLRVAHVPKTIDNDLPLPPGIPTFGFETARATATGILSTLLEDAHTAGRWYVVVLMGRNAGHLALGAAHSAGATLALVAEEFGDATVRLDDLAGIIEGSMLKRIAEGHAHGVVVLAEGLGECLDANDLAAFPDLPRDEHGHVRLAELPLGRLVRDRVQAGLAELGLKATMVAKDVGYELRCVAPNAFDQEYTRDLGAGAVERLIAGDANVMITRQQQGIVALPFDQLLDPETGRTRVRMLDPRAASFESARALQTRLSAAELADESTGDLIAEPTQLDRAGLIARYAGLPA